MGRKSDIISHEPSLPIFHRLPADTLEHLFQFSVRNEDIEHLLALLIELIHSLLSTTATNSRQGWAIPFITILLSPFLMISYFSTPIPNDWSCLWKR